MDLSICAISDSKNESTLKSKVYMPLSHFELYLLETRASQKRGLKTNHLPNKNARYLFCNIVDIYNVLINIAENILLQNSLNI